MVTHYVKNMVYTSKTLYAYNAEGRGSNKHKLR